MELLMQRIGMRIRDLRQKRGMTQKHLVGEHMTRNMLSLIENGQAAPSLATVLYLAERLGVPAGYFFAASEEDERCFYRMMVIPEIKQLYRDGSYEECERRIQEIPEGTVDDEIAYISARCFLETALRCAADYALKSADNHLLRADDAIHRTIYAGEDLKLAVRYYRELIGRLSVAEDISVSPVVTQNISAFIPTEMLRYFADIQRYAANPRGFSVRDWEAGSFHGRHLHALYLLASEQKKQAILILRELAEDTALPFYMRYRVCSDLEDAANGDGDFRAAYDAARWKLMLMDNAKR
ncbi:MAG: helix-turn-helix transcriptional regulator [Ruminococcaceae bacterium]|nr:helix-turn-helix transcriptional regulator [Oscillospiraceae bacterium]